MKSQDNDEDEEDEPKLKYERLAGTLSETLKKDAVSSMSVSDRFLALGTHWGVVHILDLIGTEVKQYRSHSATINSLSIDTNGEYVASASDDGKVVINSLYTSENQIINYKRPVKAIALEPDYSKKSTRQFVSGGMAEVLSMSGKGWFGTRDATISSGEGPIYSVLWRENFIAWANEAGVKIYDVAAQQKFAYVDRPPNSPRADLFRCHLVWKSDTQLLIGWADSVKLCVIKERSKMDISSGLPSRYVEIVCQFRTEFIISGIAPFDTDIVLLAYMADMTAFKNVDVIQSGPAKRSKAKPPEIHIVTPTGQTVATDVLSLFGYELYNANDYRLEYLPASGNPADNTFYIVSPKDIVVAKPRDLDDHVEWLVERKRYEEALLAAESAGPNHEGRLQVHSIVSIGLKYLETLLDEGRFAEAAASCRKILRTDAKLWEDWIGKYAAAGQLNVIYTYIPTHDPQLPPELYTRVLDFLLHNDLPALRAVLDTWQAQIYDVGAMVTSVEEMLAKDTENDLLRDIAILLHTHYKKFDRALYYALTLRRPDALDLVKQHNLYAFVQNHALLVMQYDDYVVTTDPHIANAHQVVEQLKPTTKYLHIFLDALFRRNRLENSEFHPMQVGLYAEYDYPRLMEFLRTSSFYSVEKAYKTCEQRDLVPEMVFLLGKMGDNRRALNLIISRLGDAIEFAKEQNDEELWEDLLTYSMDKPIFIVGLLEHLGSHINPVRLIRRIPDGLEIPGLKDALIKIMTDYGIQMSLREGCEKILVSDTVSLLETLYKAQRRGLTFTEDVACSICDIPLERASTVTPAAAMEEDVDGELEVEKATIVVFFCRHVVHKGCLRAPVDEMSQTRAGADTPSKTSGRGTPVQGISKPPTPVYPHYHPRDTDRDLAIRRVYDRPSQISTPAKAQLLSPSSASIPTIALSSLASEGAPPSRKTRVLSLGSGHGFRPPKPVLVCPICRRDKGPRRGVGV
ncbi:uncharacterized protein EV422DRAFT_497948 [Fimicolochytrium jonesii]|uniref:uncharacterized protein n=1 Tax=Fimicolochytrium jonesii TaxID=1396493 RepID=UPI0022FF3794|nr:uncharacterized protein EV422DRAFT_497948 [Fimicolochytrium jonesii]KAI8819466.1 hypothetical protein EV422DRAFT_497948 [Fimicolochytrium jonesii]